MIHVQIPQFEGPMGLLLYLIKKEEMDIFDINVHEITRQYLDYIRLMKELDLEFAGEFVAMAATLIHIKSKMLLPRYDVNGEEIKEEDPRKELVQKLLEYQKYQEAAKTLGDRPLVGRDVWLRGMRENIPIEDGQILLEENALFALIGTFRSTMRRANKRVHKVIGKTKSIASRILEISGLLKIGKSIGLKELVAASDGQKYELLITFLSILELGRLGFVRLFQSENYAEIYIESKKSIDTDVISRVQEFDAAQAAEVANRILEESAYGDMLIDEEGGEEKRLENVTAATDEDIKRAESELNFIAEAEGILA